MSISKEDEELIETLFEELDTLGKTAPEAPHGWYPIGLEDNVVIASREVEDKFIFKPFPREGIWKQIGEYFEKRREILQQIGKILRKYPEYSVITF